MKLVFLLSLGIETNLAIAVPFVSYVLSMKECIVHETWPVVLSSKT